MLTITARTSTRKLRIRKSMARLFQSYVYSVVDAAEHAGYAHPSGKRFKAMNFRIRYFEERFEIDFTALKHDNEVTLAKDILQNGLRLGDVHFADTTVGIVDRHTDRNTLTARGFVCAAIKNNVTGKKIFLEPGEAKHNTIITNHSLQKYETLLGKPYTVELKIEVLKQQQDGRFFYYDKTPYKAWMATYRITAEPQMLNLLLDTGLGGDSMKNLGFLEVADG